MKKFLGGLLALVLAAAAWLPFHAEAAGRAWTGLVYQPNKPPSGTAERELHDGKDFLRNNMAATAKSTLAKAARMDPKLAEAWFWLAGAHRALKEGGDAQAALQKALQLDPSLKAHVAELDRFGPATGGKSSGSASKSNGKSSRCDDLYATCTVSATRCTMNGCQTDFSRRSTCMTERNLCYQRNGQ